MDEFPAAPWPGVLKVSSAIVTLLVAAVDYGAFRALPPAGPAHVVGRIVALSLPVMLLMSVLFIVTGFAVDGRTLYVRRMLWSTRFDLAGLRQIGREPDAIKGSVRIFGNAGLYSFSGIYRSKKLGRYRLFATDPARSVAMICSAGTVVVTPADPDAFIGRVQRLYPAARTPGGGSRSTPDRHIHPTS